MMSSVGFQRSVIASGAPNGNLRTTLFPMTAGLEHEEETIKSFVLREKQERFLSFLAKVKNRKKLTQELSHSRWVDRRFAGPVSWKVDPSLKLWDRHLQGIENICRLLESKGAGKKRPHIS